MFIVTFDSAAVNAPSISRPAEPRPFGQGILRRRPSGPTLADLAYESGRTIVLEAEHVTDAPAHYTPAEVEAFEAGQAEGLRVLAARAADHFAELAEDQAAMEAVSSGYAWL